MKQILNHLFEHNTLDRQQAREMMLNIGKGNCNQSQLTAFMTVYLMRTITVDELQGFREALLELCLPVKFDTNETIDMCGTGGDTKNTFNISTLAALVVAGAGFKVTKHGNYGVSSISGSSNVMEYLGYKFTNANDTLQRQLDEANICFLHAPLFHPAMKNVAPVRKELGIKTFFNMLGPLVNPCKPHYQCTGVYNRELARIYNYLLQQTGREYVIIHSYDGYDEFSLTSDCKVYSKAGERDVRPEQFGLNRYCEADLYGGESVADAAKIFMNVLNNNSTKAQMDVMLANAAVAIHCMNAKMNFADCFAAANESVVSGKAKKSLEILIK